MCYEEEDASMAKDESKHRHVAYVIVKEPGSTVRCVVLRRVFDGVDAVPAKLLPIQVRDHRFKPTIFSVSRRDLQVWPWPAEILGIKGRPAPGAVQGIVLSRGGTRGRPSLAGKPEPGAHNPQNPDGTLHSKKPRSLLLE